MTHVVNRPVVVVGSVNMDLVIPVSRLPVTGETLTGGELIMNPGGKGANQAVAVQRAAGLRGACRFIGCVGDDVFGRQMRESLQAENIDISHLLEVVGVATGSAVILVDGQGDNSIVISPGANAQLGLDDISSARDSIIGAAVLLVQLETPLEAVVASVNIACSAGILTILDPAPAPPPQASKGLAALPDELWQVDIFSPNQIEAQLFTGVRVSDLDSAREAGERLLNRGPRTVVLKLGDIGAAILERDHEGETVFTHVPSIPIPAVIDTTAAGDSFSGTMAAALAEGYSLLEAVRFAVVAGALACTRAGAQASIPKRDEILQRTSCGSRL